MQQPVPLLLQKIRHQFGPVVRLSPHEKPVLLNLSSSNEQLTPAIFNYTPAFSSFIKQTLAANNARFGVGGYLENRGVYSRSTLFNGTDSERAEARTIHLGVDIWGEAGTPVYVPIGGTVHSFAYNNNFGDYGATIILQHQVDGITFYTLYGHLSLADLRYGQNQFVSVGEQLASFGPPEENGHWPPHLHFQVIIDMEMKEGDYPGVCSPGHIEYYSANCPDPDLILNLVSKAVPAKTR